MRRFLDRKSDWARKWTMPTTRRKYTLFGYGQHYGMTDCESCGKTFIRNSGIQRCCGPYNDKESCAYKAYLLKKKMEYRQKIYGYKIDSPIIIYNTTGKPSEILMC